MSPSRRLRGLIATGVALLLAASSPVMAHAGPVAREVDLTCALALVKSDPDTVNVAFPDEGAIYFGLVYNAVPGTRLRINGHFPKARYMSWNAYDPQLRPTHALADAVLRPDRGSTNPFLSGARRDGARRTYTMFVEFTARPARPAPNTLYVGADAGKAPSAGGGLIYRVYVPDRGLNDRGGVPLPKVTWELSRSGPSTPVPPSLCRELDRPAFSTTNDAVAGAEGIEALDPMQPWGQPVPQFRKFQNLPTSVADFTLSSPALYEEVRPHLDPAVGMGGEGGFLSNVHNAYVTTVINRSFGKVLQVRFRAPRTPRTLQAPRRMPAGGQVRYWSLCQNEFFTQRFIDCQYDEQVVADRRGWVTFVVSTPSERPRSARPRCGVNWLAWGPDAEGVLILRHMLPSRGFTQSIQRATYGKEARTMGDFLPRARYHRDAAAYDTQRGACR